MSDQILHDNAPEFDVFVENTLDEIGKNAQEQGICMECLSDRLVVDLVSALARSGVGVSAILAMVGEGIEAAGNMDASSLRSAAKRMH